MELLLLSLLFVFAVPFAHAVLKAIDAGRDPSIRVTPIDVWLHANRVMNRALTVWLFVWLGVLAAIYLLAPGFIWVLSHLWRGTTPLTQDWLAHGWYDVRSFRFRLFWTTLILGQWLLIFSATLVLGPRWRRRFGATPERHVSLAVASVAVSLLFYGLATPVVHRMVRSFYYVEARGQAPNCIVNGKLYIYPEMNSVVCLIVALSVWSWVERKRTTWLRLEE